MPLIIQHRCLSAVSSLVIAVPCVVGVGGCRMSAEHDPQQASSQQGAQAMTASQRMLAPVLMAHGGLDQWRSRGTMRFTHDQTMAEKPPQTDRHIVDLRSRRVRIEGEGYTLGTTADGRAWITPDADALGMPPAFYAGLAFYFNAMPFVLADSGVNVAPTGTRVIDARTYDTYRATMNEGVGASPKDDYRLFVDPESHRLQMIEFSVTHPAMQKDKPLDQALREWLVFDEWQKVDGLVLPRRATFYLSQPGEDGPVRGKRLGSYEVRDVSLSEVRPKASLFQPPADARFVDGPSM